MFEYFVYTYGMEIIGLLLVAVAGCVGIALRSCLNRWVQAETSRLDDETKIGIARAAAAFVEQAWKTLHGPAKLKAALDKARKLLEKKGIEFDADEMEVLIEAAVAEFNEAFKKPVENENAAGAYRVPEFTLCAETMPGPGAD